MGKPFELNTYIVTEGKAKRLEENLFCLVKEGYHLYPLDHPVEIKRKEGGEACGTAIIKKMIWENNRTTIEYQMISLYTIN